jgi:hypothetical protein
MLFSRVVGLLSGISSLRDTDRYLSVLENRLCWPRSGNGQANDNQFPLIIETYPDVRRISELLPGRESAHELVAAANLSASFYVGVAHLGAAKPA